MNHWKSYEITSTFILKGKQLRTCMKLILNRNIFSALRHQNRLKTVFEIPKRAKNDWIEMVHS